LKTNIHVNYISLQKHSDPTSHRTHSASITKTIRLTLLRQTIGVHCNIRNTLTLQVVVREVTTGF